MLLRRVAFPDFCEPCLPSPADNSPAGAGWLHEIKHDGFRMLVRRDAAGVRLFTRHGHNLLLTSVAVTKRCKLADRVKLRLGNALDLPYSDQTFDVVWCQNVTMNIADKAGLLAGVYRVLKPGGLFTATEYSVGRGGDIIFPVP